jgi:hypothetical protein
VERRPCTGKAANGSCYHVVCRPFTHLHMHVEQYGPPSPLLHDPRDRLLIHTPLHVHGIALSTRNTCQWEGFWIYKCEWRPARGANVSRPSTVQDGGFFPKVDVPCSQSAPASGSKCSFSLCSKSLGSCHCFVHLYTYLRHSCLRLCLKCHEMALQILGILTAERTWCAATRESAPASLLLPSLEHICSRPGGCMLFVVLAVEPRLQFPPEALCSSESA